MKITITTPTKAVLTDMTALDKANIELALSWRDKTKEYELQRAKKSKKMPVDMGLEKYQEYLKDIKSQIKQSCLKQDEFGEYSVASGLVSNIKKSIPSAIIENKIKYPEPQIYAWDKQPPALRPYQQEAVNKLLQAKHAGIEAGTGAGKSLILLYLTRELGLKTLVMAPSRSIAEQLFNTFTQYLGPRRVGMFGDSKKQSKPDIVVGIAASLAKVAPDSPHYEALSNRDVFIADESHQCPADTFESVCQGLMQRAPYRFFVSGTQMRGDGKDLILEGLVGDIVYKITVPELVEMGYLAKPRFMAVGCQSVTYANGQPKKFTDVRFAHKYNFLSNPNVSRSAANVINNALKKQLQVLVLIDEIGQAAPILNMVPYDRKRVGFAHAANAKHEKLPPEWAKSEPNELVKKFNNKEIDLLIGTSCIVTGTDIQTVDLIVYLMGGLSEIQVKQAIGRGTRKPEGKSEFWFCDFDVVDCPYMHRHFQQRKKIYESLSSDPVKLVGKTGDKSEQA